MSKAEESLVVVWSSADREVAMHTVFLYTFNAKAKGWWQDVRFIIWGPSGKLLAQDKELQDWLKRMKEEGIVVEACKKCSDELGVSGKLEELGVNVYYIGRTLSDYLQEGRKVITF